MNEAHIQLSFAHGTDEQLRADLRAAKRGGQTLKLTIEVLVTEIRPDAGGEDFILVLQGPPTIQK